LSIDSLEFIIVRFIKKTCVRPLGAGVDIGADEFSTTTVRLKKAGHSFLGNSPVYGLTIFTTSGLSAQNRGHVVINVNLEGRIIR